jgi:hypothetical protein
MAAGLEKTALMASWGLAMPTPPMAREMGPTPIRLSPLVADAVATSKRVKPTTIIVKVILAFIALSFRLDYRHQQTGLLGVLGNGATAKKATVKVSRPQVEETVSL